MAPTGAGPLAVWSAVAVLGVVPFVLTHIHVLGGGFAHPRYLLPVVPLAAAAVAFVVGSASRRVAAVAAVATLAAATFALGRSVAERRTGFLGNQIAPLVDGPAIPVTIVVVAVGLVLSTTTALRPCDGVGSDPPRTGA